MIKKELEWRDPPDHGNRGSGYAPLIAELKANPGRWAMIGTWSNRQKADRLRKRYGVRIATHRLSKEEIEIFAMWPDGTE